MLTYIQYNDTNNSAGSQAQSARSGMGNSEKDVPGNIFVEKRSEIELLSGHWGRFIEPKLSLGLAAWSN